jgi:hypothetical protein
VPTALNERHRGFYTSTGWLECTGRGGVRLVALPVLAAAHEPQPLTAGGAA